MLLLAASLALASATPVLKLDDLEYGFCPGSPEPGTFDSAKVSCDWWRAGHVTAVLTSDWPAGGPLPRVPGRGRHTDHQRVPHHRRGAASGRHCHPRYRQGGTHRPSHPLPGPRGRRVRIMVKVQLTLTCHASIYHFLKISIAYLIKMN